MKMATLNVYPAYLRKYKTEAEAKKDWDEGLDFKIYNGPYFSKRDVPALQKEGYVRIAVHDGKGVIAVIDFEEEKAS